jgi:precorrin-2 dehydrogenase/sirohydrochlorin ferrochelatase
MQLEHDQRSGKTADLPNLRKCYKICQNLYVLCDDLACVGNSSGETAMSCYPICLNNLDDILCVVVGGGSVAERKTRSLLEAGAAVKIVSPELTTGLQQLADQGKLTHVSRSCQPGDVEGAFLVVAATDDPETNKAVAREASGSQMLVNVVDDPQLGNFTMPATLSRGALSVSVSTGGRSPALAAHVKKRLEHVVGPEYADFTDILGELRDPVTRSCPPEHRRELWHRLIDSDVLDRLRRGEVQAAKESAQHIVSAYIAAL